MNPAALIERAAGAVRAPAAPLAEALDCMQANLAALADVHHGAGFHLRLGAVLRARARSGPDGLPTVEPTLAEHLAQAGALLGLAVRRRRERVGAHRLGHSALEYVVADAYHLGWTPYFQQRHMPHSFLVTRVATGEYEVYDAYHNDTPWGRARPGSRRLTLAELSAALPHGADVALEFEPAPIAQQPPAVMVEPFDVEAFVEPFRRAADRRAALDRLCLETWLLERDRRLHAAFRASAGANTDTAADAQADIDAHLARWRSVVEQTYVAYRRVERGRPEPPGTIERLADVLREDARVFGGGLAAPAAPRAQAADRDNADAIGAGADAPAPRGGDALWTQFAAVVGRVLGLSAERLAALRSLAEVPSANSLRIVELVEALEGRFGIRFEPEDLMPESLRDPDHLYALVRRGHTASAGADSRGSDR